MGYDGKGQIRVRHARLTSTSAFAAMGGQPCVLEQLRRPRLRGLGDRRAQRATARRRRGRWPRTGIATASSTSRSCRRASRRSCGACARHRDARSPTALDYRGVLCVEMFVTGRRRAAGQRDRAAAAQQRPLHDRRLRHVAVRAAGARARRPAARRSAAARRRGDGEPAGRHLVRRRRTRQRRASRTGRAVLAASAGEAASLRQGGTAPRPQDGPRDVPRRSRSTTRSRPRARSSALRIPGRTR